MANPKWACLQPMAQRWFDNQPTVTAFRTVHHITYSLKDTQNEMPCFICISHYNLKGDIQWKAVNLKCHILVLSHITKLHGIQQSFSCYILLKCIFHHTNDILIERYTPIRGKGIV
jgi:hypothetical protein